MFGILTEYLEILRNVGFKKFMFTGSFVILTFYIGKMWDSYRFFKKRGIKTPKYEFFFGNTRIIQREKKLSEQIAKWSKEYGKTFGIFQGHTPYLVTSDLDLLNEILIKQYANFSAKKKQPLDREDDASKIMIISAVGGRWKRMRNIMNPTFSTSKMKELTPHMHSSIDRLLKKINENLDNEIDVMKILKKFTMDTIWKCGFGIDRDMQFSSMGDLYIHSSDESLKNFANYSFLAYLSIYFSEFRKYIVYCHLAYNHIMNRLFGVKYVDPLFWIREEIIEVVDSRRSLNVKRRDYLQLLMDACSDSTTSIHENEKINFSQIHLKKKLTIDEIKMNLSIFLMAGSESTSIALTVLLYVLATLPEEQQKLINEIDEYFPLDREVEPTYDEIQKLEYLDFIIKETLRMWPIANAACTRRCVKRCNINGIDFPEDLTIIVDVLSIHYNKDLWGPVDPHVFHPMRFGTKRNALAYMAFGAGPRNCIGMKFALMELKMCLIKIFSRFEVKTTENTNEKLDFIEGVIGILTHEVKLMFQKRKI